MIGVNGSVGKTSCRMIVMQTLQKFLPHKVVYTSSKNFNGELWFPLSIFCVDAFIPTIYHFIYTFFHAIDLVYFSKKAPYDIIVLEYGIDRPGEMSFLLHIVKPDIGIFTAMDSVHSEQFGDPQAIAQEEIKMILATKETAFLNHDDMYAMQLYDRISIEKFTYQTEWYSQQADIHFDRELFIYDDGVRVTFDLLVKSHTMTIKTNMIGKAHYGYIGVWLTIADMLSYKYTGNGIIKSLDVVTLDYALQPGRLSILSWYKDSVIVDASYNASPRSVTKIINTVYTLRQQLYPDHKIIVMLGDMKELGDFAEQEHRKLAAYVHGVADDVFLVGQMMSRFVYDELCKIGYTERRIRRYLSSVEAGDALRNLLKKSKGKYIIVFKGSQNTIFLEEAIKKILAYPADVAQLPRQGDWWTTKKNVFFGGHSDPL